MTAARQPRRSALADLSPVTPVSPIAPASTPLTEPERPSAQTRGAEPERAVPARTSPRPNKISVYQDPALTARIQAAIAHTAPQEGLRSMSQFVNDAIVAELDRLEVLYNGGRPFPPARHGAMPVGRQPRAGG